jgi:hypothetical protein
LKDIYHVSCQQWDRWFIKVLGTSPFTTAKSVLSFGSVLHLRPGPRAERNARCTRLRGAVHWLGPPLVTRRFGLVCRLHAYHLRHACVLSRLFMAIWPHAPSRPCVPRLLRLAHLPVWRLDNLAYSHPFCAYLYHTFSAP